MVLALGLTGLGVLPFVGTGATAAATAADPPLVEPCDVGEACPPQTTVTITTTLPTPTPTPEPPETTITRTVTASPTRKTQSPKPSRTTEAPASTPTTRATAAPPPEQLLPTQSAQVPDVTATTEDPAAEESVQMPTVAGTDTPVSTPPATDAAASFESESPQWEMRNAAPEYDQRSLTQRLSIPALIMVLLALFAVLIFEGRLRRMAHAAAVRKAGPQVVPPVPPTQPVPPGAYPYPPEGYPAGPGYATAAVAAPGYPGGTAYAPIISFVPVQTFPSGQVQYGAVYHDPNAVPVPPQPQQQEPEPVVLSQDRSGAYTQQQEPEQKEFRDPFEPVIPPEQPPADIPPHGADPYDETVERPLGPASAAEQGDSEPWSGRTPEESGRTVEERFPDDRDDRR